MAKKHLEKSSACDKDSQQTRHEEWYLQFKKEHLQNLAKIILKTEIGYFLPKTGNKEKIPSPSTPSQHHILCSEKRQEKEIQDIQTGNK